MNGRRDDTVASLGVPVEIVPGLSAFGYEHTPSNSYRFVWTDVAINRDTNNLETASIELFRDGGVCVTTNGVAAYLPRELSSEINDEQFKMTRPLNRNNVNVV